MVDKTYLKLYRPTVIYLHRVQVTYLFPKSDYVYRTFKVFFNSVRKYLISGEISKPLKGYDPAFLRGWYLNDNMVWNGKKYRYGIANSDLGIFMFTRSIREDKPINVAFYGEPWREKREEAFSAFRAASSNDRPELGPEPTVIQISKRWDKDTGKLLGVGINVIFTGDPEKNWDIKIIDWVFGLMFRWIEWREIAERKLTRIEHFIRLPAVVEEEVEVVDEKTGKKRTERRIRYLEMEVKELIDLILDKWGIPADVNLKQEDKLHEDDEGNKRRVSKVHRGMFCYFSTGYRVDLKIYRKKKFRLPEQHYTDHPKVEAVHYNVDWKDVRAVKEEGREILASIVEILGIHDYVIPDPDHPVSGKAFANPLIVNAILKEDLLKRIQEKDPLMRFRLSERELRIIEELLRRGRLTSDDLEEIGKAMGVGVRDVQYHLKKLRKKGLVLRFRRGRKNKYYYFFNFDALIADEENNQERQEIQTQLDESMYYAMAAELERLNMNDNIAKTYILVKYGFNTTKAIAKVLGVTPRQVRNYLTVLKEKGLVKSRKVGKKTFYQLADYESLMRAPMAQREDSGLGLGGVEVGEGQVVGSVGGKEGGSKGVGSGGAAQVGASPGQQAKVSGFVPGQRVVGSQEEREASSIFEREGFSKQSQGSRLCDTAGRDPGEVMGNDGGGQ